METMVEKVARALAKASNSREEHWRDWETEARGAIEAMREPTPEMVRQTVDFMFTVRLGGSYRWPDYARDVHCCMIDAALLEKE